MSWILFCCLFYVAKHWKSPHKQFQLYFNEQKTLLVDLIILINNNNTDKNECYMPNEARPK